MGESISTKSFSEPKRQFSCCAIHFDESPDSEAAALQTWVANEAVLDDFLLHHPGPSGEYD
jgi:hypothetical protein